MKKTYQLGILLVLIMLAGALLTGCGGSGNNNSGSSSPGSDIPVNANSTGNVAAGYQEISAAQLKSMMDSDKDLVVVDVREQFEYQQGHLEKSALIPIGEVESRLNELPKDKKVVLVCATGARSASVANYLVQQGYQQVYNLTGGVSTWPHQLVK